MVGWHRAGVRRYWRWRSRSHPGRPRLTDEIRVLIRRLAERWVGSCRREILDHVVVLNEGHLRRLMREYVSYYHQDRIHDSLGKDTPMHRPVDRKISAV